MSERICLQHVCIRVSNLKQAEVFYSGFLGLKKLNEFTLSVEHAQTLFQIPQACKFISFECPDGGGLEIFTTAGKPAPPALGSHFCLGIYHRNEIVEKLLQANVTVREIAREGRKIIFVLDPDENLIELKDLEV